jgi:hypothetical protein
MTEPAAKRADWLAGKRLLWLGLMLVVTAVLWRVAELRQGASWVANHRTSLETSSALFGLGVLALVVFPFRKRVAGKPLVRAGLHAGVLMSCAVIYTKLGWIPWLLAVVPGSRAARQASGSASQMSASAAPPPARRGAALGARAALLGCVVLWLVGVPASYATGRLWASAFSAAGSSAPGSFSPEREELLDWVERRTVSAPLLAGALVTAFGVPLTALGGLLAASSRRRREGHPGEGDASSAGAE